jgi:hypothetical protein
LQDILLVSGTFRAGEVGGTNAIVFLFRRVPNKRLQKELFTFVIVRLLTCNKSVLFLLDVIFIK